VPRPHPHSNPKLENRTRDGPDTTSITALVVAGDPTMPPLAIPVTLHYNPHNTPLSNSSKSRRTTKPQNPVGALPSRILVLNSRRHPP